MLKGPLAQRGQRIGLLGGSFDPPHAGHLHISRRALREVGLDRVWWLVSPGNPLKARGPAEFERRMEACRALADHPRIDVTDIERQLGSPYTANTLRRLIRRYPGVRFIWLMGADNLAGFHRWQEWRWIAATVPMAVFSRPGEQLRAGLSRTATVFRHARLPAAQAPALARGDGVRWSLLPGPMLAHSSTALRGNGGWP